MNTQSVSHPGRAHATPARRGPVFGARTAVVLALIGSALSTSGCFPLAATGIVVGGLAAADRRTVGAQTEDNAIELKAYNDLRQQLGGTAGISVTSYNRAALLTGQVQDERIKRRAGEVVARIANVRTVHNELVISAVASIGTSAADATLTTRVKAAFFDAKDLQSNTLKVVSEAGVVYLMGIVTRAEGDRAAQVVSGLSGVKRVVTLFEYVTPEELANIERTNREAQNK